MSVFTPPAKLSDEDRRLIRNGVLGEFENLIVFVEKPLPGLPRWRLVNRSDVPDLPPGISANMPMEDETRNHVFTTDVAGELVQANFFCRVEAGKSQRGKI